MTVTAKPLFPKHPLPTQIRPFPEVSSLEICVVEDAGFQGVLDAAQENMGILFDCLLSTVLGSSKIGEETNKGDSIPLSNAFCVLGVDILRLPSMWKFAETNAQILGRYPSLYAH